MNVKEVKIGDIFIDNENEVLKLIRINKARDNFEFLVLLSPYDMVGRNYYGGSKFFELYNLQKL